MFENIVVGLKEGLPHEPLLELATSVTRPGARIHLVTLVKVGTQEDEPERLERARRDVEDHAETLRARGYEVTHDVGLIVVAAAADLLRIANDRGADLIVIGLAKRTRVGKALMGSDAQRVLLGAECPVLVTQLFD
jgi:nucleotide-binding universal stress UspA family protein